MRKVLSFSLFLMLGLVASQLLPGALGTAYPGFKATADTLLYICLGFIMINVGREFEIDKSRWRSYTADYFIAMATAALPWLLIVLYYIFVLLPSDLWTRHPVRLRGVEGESAAEPFRGPDLGRYPLHDARRVKPEKQLDIP